MGPKGEEIVVSRSANGLIQGLFQREVPEVAQGSVEIKAVVREPGNRSKVAVFSSQSGIDPVGSCVGQKGVRVQAIIQELGGLEKIDIVQYSAEIKQYIAQALSPAKNLTVEINEEEKVARVFVPRDELSLAIGKEGQNVRLAYKLTGYRIEIQGNEEPEEEVKEEKKAEEPVSEKVSKEEVIKDTSASSVQEEVASESGEVLEEKEAKEEVPAEEAKTEESEAVSEEKTEEIKDTSASSVQEEVAEESGEVASDVSEDTKETDETKDAEEKTE